MSITPGSFILRNHTSVLSGHTTAVDYLAKCPGCGAEIIWTQTEMPWGVDGSKNPTPGPCVSCADTDIDDEVA